jgi:hypothetical protein
MQQSAMITAGESTLLIAFDSSAVFAIRTNGLASDSATP